MHEMFIIWEEDELALEEKWRKNIDAIIKILVTVAQMMYYISSIYFWLEFIIIIQLAHMD